MADDVEVVRITHKELLSMDNKGGNSSSGRPRRKKRPDIAIYTPVHRRLENKQTHQDSDESSPNTTRGKHENELESRDLDQKRDSKGRTRRGEKELYIPRGRSQSEDGENSVDNVEAKAKMVSSPPVAIPKPEIAIDWAEEVENELYGTPDDTAEVLDAYERSGWTDPSIILEQEKKGAKQAEKVAKPPVVKEESLPDPLVTTLVFERSKPVSRGDWKSDDKDRGQKPPPGHGRQDHHGGDKGHRRGEHHGSHGQDHGPHRRAGHHQNGHHGDHGHYANLPPRLQAKQQERRETGRPDQSDGYHERDHSGPRARPRQSRSNDSHGEGEQGEMRGQRRRGRPTEKQTDHAATNDSHDSGRALTGRSDQSPHNSSQRGGVGRGRRRVNQPNESANQVTPLVRDLSLDDTKRGVIVMPKETSTSPAPTPIGRGRGRGRKLYDPEDARHPPPVAQHHYPDQESATPPMAVPQPFQQRVPPVPMMHVQMTNMPPMFPPYIMPSHMPHMPMYDPSMGPPPHAPPPPAAPVSVDRRRSEMLRQEIGALDKKLFSLTSQRAMPDDNKEMSRCRIEMTMKCEELILNDAESAQKWGIDQILWKSVYYNTLTVYRNLDLDESENRNGLVSLLDEGIAFYGTLIRKLEHRYDCGLQNYFFVDRPRPEGESRLVKFALVLAQALMLYLGDLHRYKDDFNQAKRECSLLSNSWYMKAQMIMPKNSQPYNRLAVLATHMKKWLEAVYYHMRSLEACNANPAAREALILMFEEVRKKAEFERQKSRAPSHDERPRGPREPARTEVWVAHDGSKSSDKTETPSTVYKRFILNYLFAQGKLYSKTGLDDLADVCVHLYADFARVLTMDPCPIDQDRLIKLVIINIFMVHHTGPVEQSQRSQQKLLRQDYSLVLGLDLFSILVQRFLHLLRQHTASNNYPRQVLDPALAALYPAVKIWSDWMTFTQRVWNPPPTEDLGSPHDVWTLLAELGTAMEKMDISHVKFLSEQVDGCEPLVLPEDVLVEGFKPLIGLVKDTTFIHSTCEKDHARDCLRVQKLQYFSEFLSGLVPPVLRFDVQKRCYLSAVEHYIYSDGSQNSSGTTQSEGESDEEVVVEAIENDDESTDDNVKQLKARKQQLQKQMSEINKQKTDHQAVLDQERARGVLLEIHPLFLVPDTNCFIDHLHLIVQLLATRRYTIVVPLVVINELDYLARGQERPAVMRTAQKVVRFLEEEFEVKREPRLKAMTSKGTLMETIAYRSESIDDKGNNDDLILACCLHYCQDRAKDFMPKNPEDPVKLYREVVLLTDDRNLRLKAHTRNVPVRDLVSFADYAGLCDTT